MTMTRRTTAARAPPSLPVGMAHSRRHGSSQDSRLPPWQGLSSSGPLGQHQLLLQWRCGQGKKRGRTQPGRWRRPARPRPSRCLWSVRTARSSCRSRSCLPRRGMSLSGERGAVQGGGEAGLGGDSKQGQGWDARTEPGMANDRAARAAIECGAATGCGCTCQIKPLCGHDQFYPFSPVEEGGL